MGQLIRPLVLLALLGLGAVSRVDARDDLDPIPRSDLGKPYDVVRPVLLKLGDAPVGESQDTARACIGAEDLCSKYPEIDGCAVDRPLCRLEWRSASGLRFYIIASRDTADTLVVRGMRYDEKGP